MGCRCNKGRRRSRNNTASPRLNNNQQPTPAQPTTQSGIRAFANINNSSSPNDNISRNRIEKLRREAIRRRFGK